MAAKSTAVAITADEAIALLKNTSLPTIVVEGNDDMLIYRKLEEELSSLNVSVLPVGGRGNVLKLFERRGELPAANKILFISDKDMWVISGVPPQFHDAALIFTNGYSIENDVFVDGNFISMLSAAERAEFENDLDQFVQWYALAVSRHLIDPTNPISNHPDCVLDASNFPSLTALRTGESYPARLRGEIRTHYSSHIRGKSLFYLFFRQAAKPKRPVKHNVKSLMETVGSRPGALVGSIFSTSREFFGTT